MTVGSFEGRLLVAAVPVVLMLAWDILRPWLMSKFRPEPEEWMGEDAPLADVPARSVGAEEGETSSRPTETMVPTTPEARERISRLRRRENLQEAQKKWIAARGMAHQFIPSWKMDGKYLGLLHQAAVAGDAAAMNKLSEYAFRRCAFVEAYYWKVKLQMQGGQISDPTPQMILNFWKTSGCPAQYNCMNPGFTEEQGMFARSVMRLSAGVDVAKANERLTMLSKEGNPDAQQYLKRGKRRMLKL